MKMKNNKNNSGYKKSGYWNSGIYNSGDWNSGYRNSGTWNSGDWNSGTWNSGNWNSGNRNSGDWNSGNRNSGDWNSGTWNSGNRNSGDWNSGTWNSGNKNSGFLNTTEPKIRMFDKETDKKRVELSFPQYFFFDLTEWISKDEMSDKEKEENSFYKSAGGYLKTYDYKEAWKKSFEEKCDKKQAEQTINLPNFDYAKFEEITGITKEMLEKKLGTCEHEDNFNYCPTCGVKLK